MDPHKAYGCDYISPYIIKSCIGPLLEHITNLFTYCIQYCTIPDEWKIHKICPIPKGGSRSDITNYRPISLLCILESVIYRKIITFIRPRISLQQFGFLSNRSCLSQLLLSYSNIFESIENGQYSDVIYLDFKKAFDTVPHSELLFKLWQIGITGPLWSWFQNYLSNRLYYVEIDNVTSTLLLVISGIPQGSILGPLLFIIYINDLPEAITSSSTYLFADDTKLIHSVSTFYDQSLQSDLDSLSAWCHQWKLSLNPSKCSYIRFSLSHKETTVPNYSINSNEIQLVSTQRDLGISISSDLSWTNHINQICAKAYRTLQFIRRSIHSQSPSQDLKRCLYITLVRSKLTYCSQLWRPHLIKDIVMLETVQRRSTKFLLDNSSSNYKQRLSSLDLLPLMYWLEIQDILLLIKNLQNPGDNFNIYDHISFASSNTRSATTNKLKYNYRQTTATRHYYFNRVVRLWNSLPPFNLSQPYVSIKRQIYTYFRNHFIVNFDPDNPCSFHYLCPCSSCHFLCH